MEVFCFPSGVKGEQEPNANKAPTVESPCFAPGLVEERKQPCGFLALRPAEVIPPEISAVGFNLALSPEQVKALDEASQIDPGFPYHLYAKEHVRAVAYGGMRDQILA